MRTVSYTETAVDAPLDPTGRPLPTSAPLGAGLVGEKSHAELAADLLSATGLLSPSKIETVRARLQHGGTLAQAIVDEGLASADGLARTYASRFHLPLVDLHATGVSPDASRLVPRHVLERLVAIPYMLHDGYLKVAVADPQNIHGIDELRLATRYPLELSVANRDTILQFLDSASRDNDIEVVEEAPEPESLIPMMLTGEDFVNEDGITEGPIVRLVNTVIQRAAEDGASDIHFEPQEEWMVVRTRVDGVLHEVQRIPREMAAGLITRLKVLAKLDIAERRKPQDGRISLQAMAAGRAIDIRLATLPTVEGESAVMRLMDKSKKAPTLEELGLSEQMRETLAEIVKRPTGALLVTGPTGSGKSTTLYAALAAINRPEINIITVEDPVEYRIQGVNQVQINQRAGLTFATALRSILRSDPDVVMVGEIRDAETAKISIEAAMTGHMVLSTLHTNDAPSAITRLGEMGVEPYLTGSAVSAVLAQRLARKLCPHCCEMYVPTEDEIRAANAPLPTSSDGVVFYRKRGCPRCNQTGYRGRVGVFQLLIVDDEIERLACTGASRDEIERGAEQGGMRTMWHDGIAKVMAGLTSIEELARVVTF